MPNPKKRHSRCKRMQRRSHDALTAPALSTCPQCGESKQPHHVCPHCGTYRGMQVLKKKDEAV
ncbi:MAG: 50S ribosomal protein L32 [Deltaproteobacteria bacterium]|nr:50S ribosomal protein L32 [Deltaproteobacteria bacterium]